MPGPLSAANAQAALGVLVAADAAEPPASDEAGGGPLAELVAQEQTARLEALLARLSPAQADALRLRFYGGLKFQEIADAMQCSLGTAKNRVRWGLLRLADLIRGGQRPAARGPAADSAFEDVP